ncbi:MAG: hypothetical protein ACRYGC_03935 [Janthinobacterium lividum]
MVMGVASLPGFGGRRCPDTGVAGAIVVAVVRGAGLAGESPAGRRSRGAGP